MFFALTTGRTSETASRESFTRSVVLGLRGVEGFVDMGVLSRDSDVSLDAKLILYVVTENYEMMA